MSKEQGSWRHNLQTGDLVMMKSGHLAIITKVDPFPEMNLETEPVPPPGIEILYCEDSTAGSCSSWRVERVASANR